jgi:hypothetical protein
MTAARRCAGAGLILAAAVLAFPDAVCGESPGSLRYLERQAERGVESGVWRGEAERRQERLERLERQQTEELRGLRGDLEDRAHHERIQRLLEDRE